MKRGELHTPYVLEWSPRGMALFDGNAGTTRTVASFAEVATTTREVIVGLSRRIVFIRTVRVPNAAPEEVRQVLTMRLADLFPVPVQDLAYDFQLTNDVNPEGRLALVAAVPTSELTRLFSEAKAANVRIAAVVPVAIGSAHLVEADGPAAVVQQTHDGYAIDIVAQGVLRHSRVTTVASQLGAEVCRTFTLANLPCGPMVGAGGLAFDDAEVVTKETSLSSLSRAQAEVKMNLELPDAVAARHRAARAQKQRIAILMCVAALGLGAYVFMDYQDSVAKSKQATESQKRKLADMQKLADKAKDNLAQAQSLSAELERGFHPAQSFTDIATIVSNDVPAGVWLTGVNIDRGKDVSIRGTASDSNAVAAYLRALSSEQRFRNVHLVGANNSTIDQQTVVMFSLSAFPVGNLPLVEPKSTKSGVAAKGGAKP